MERQETLSEFASRIGAELRPTCLAEMAIISQTESDGKTCFGGVGWVTKWLQVKDPSGGLNKCGTWPFSVQKTRDGNIVIVGSSY